MRGFSFFSEFRENISLCQKNFPWIIHKECRYQYLFFIISANYFDISFSITFSSLPMHFFFLYIGILHLTGEPILPHLLRYSAFVVKDHNFMRCALHLQQA